MRRTLSAAVVLATSVACPSALAQPSGLGAARSPEGWPCPGCVVHVPKRLPEGPRPLLVALHGDGGAVRPLVRAWQAACDEAGVILLAPRCPVELGCPAGSYWQWLQDARHDDRWLTGLIDAVAERHPVDRKRLFATGYSGGATYFGYWLPRHPEVFGAVAHVGGGSRWGGTCPSCKVPVMFVMGATDPMIGMYTEALRDFWQGCGGHEVEWQILKGVSHESIVGVLQAGRAKDIMAWLLARPARCVEEADAGAAEAAADAGAPAPVADAGAAPPVQPPPRVPPKGGCGCGVGGESGPGPASVIAGVAAVALRRLRRKRRCRGSR